MLRPHGNPAFGDISSAYITEFSVLKKFVLILIIAVAALAAFIYTRPDDFRYERSAQIDAPPPVVFAILNDLHQGARWSPYEQRDPNMKKTFEGPTIGPGSVYMWDGNNDVGSGKMTIVDSRPNEYVASKLEFTRPFVCNNDVRFTLDPSGEGTRVAWIMEGKNNFVGKAMCLFMNMESMLAKDFDQGLADLNQVAQADARNGT